MKKKLSPKAKEVLFYMKQGVRPATIAVFMGVTKGRINYLIKTYRLTFPQPKKYKVDKGIH